MEVRPVIFRLGNSQTGGPGGIVRLVTFRLVIFRLGNSQTGIGSGQEK